jgi:hypothetical protein
VNAEDRLFLLRAQAEAAPVDIVGVETRESMNRLELLILWELDLQVGEHLVALIAAGGNDSDLLDSELHGGGERTTEWRMLSPAEVAGREAAELLCAFGRPWPPR